MLLIRKFDGSIIALDLYSLRQGHVSSVARFLACADIWPSPIMLNSGGPDGIKKSVEQKFDIEKNIKKLIISLAEADQLLSGVAAVIERKKVEDAPPKSGAEACAVFFAGAGASPKPAESTTTTEAVDWSWNTVD
jgi:hypothetical protein